MELFARGKAFARIERRLRVVEELSMKTSAKLTEKAPKKGKSKEMNQQVKTPKSITYTLTGGFVLGAVCMAAVFSGAGIQRASAAPEMQVKPRLMSSTSTESTAALHSLDTSFRNLAKFVGPAVVDIQMQSKRQMDGNGARMPVTEGEGSGFMFSPDGYIATNDHVVGDADTVKVTLKDGREFTGTVTRAHDKNSDIALVKISGKDLPYISFADSTTVEPGEFAMAIGAPFGLENTVTVGHVSALGRSNEIGDHVYTDLIQTDAAINMGNSGGPLVNVDGQVIGMNTAIYSPTGGSNGIGFAIPGNQVRLIENLLVSKGKVVRSMIGVLPEDVKEYERTAPNSLFANGGARVKEVAGEPAKSAGLQKDDVIVKIGSTDIRNQEDLRNAMLAYAPGSKEPVEVIRNGQHKTLEITLLAYKAPPAPQQQQMPQGRMRGQSPFGNGDPFGGFQGLPNPFGNQNGNGEDNNGNEEQPTAPAPRTGHATLGVQVEDLSDQNRSQFGVPSGVSGAVVVGVRPDSVAATMGMQQGDVIQSLNGKTITSAQDLRSAMTGIAWGSTEHIAYSHFGNGSRIKTERDIKFQ
jgi:serine protease Do